MNGENDVKGRTPPDPLHGKTTSVGKREKESVTTDMAKKKEKKTFLSKGR